MQGLDFLFNDFLFSICAIDIYIYIIKGREEERERDTNCSLMYHDID